MVIEINDNPPKLFLGIFPLDCTFSVPYTPPLKKQLFIKLPYVAFRDTEGYLKSVLQGRQMGYEGRMFSHPSQNKPSNRPYAPSPEDVEWVRGVFQDLRGGGPCQG